MASRVAILAHRSSNVWDPPGTAKWENQTEHTMTYQADQFGLYLALALHGGIQTDFVDEDAVLNKSNALLQHDDHICNGSSPSMDLALKSESVYKSGVLRSVIDSKLARDTSTHRVT